MMLSFKKVSLGIILLLVLFTCASADDDDDKKAEKEEEEKDPWDKSTDKYRHHLGDSGAGTHSEEPVKIDVTEVSESEVHSERSKVCKSCKLKNIVARKSPASKSPSVTAAKSVTKTPGRKHVEAAQYFDKKEVDDETKEQINDATDEKVIRHHRHHKCKHHRHHHRHHF